MYGMVWYGMVWYGMVCMYVCVCVCRRVHFVDVFESILACIFDPPALHFGTSAVTSFRHRIFFGRTKEVTYRSTEIILVMCPFRSRLHDLNPGITVPRA